MVLRGTILAAGTLGKKFNSENIEKLIFDEYLLITELTSCPRREKGPTRMLSEAIKGGYLEGSCQYGQNETE